AQMTFHVAIFALLICSLVIHEDGYAIYKLSKAYIQIRPISSPIDPIYMMKQERKTLGPAPFSPGTFLTRDNNHTLTNNDVR
ncbi:hypothetical protein ACJX0J_026258, partial [Zea mays]